ncbi:hypothetical protein RI367_007890 [Sorochytrium milnesiophthora]
MARSPAADASLSQQWWTAVLSGDAVTVSSVLARQDSTEATNALLKLRCPPSLAPSFDADFADDAEQLLGTSTEDITAISAGLLAVDSGANADTSDDAAMERKLETVQLIIKATPAYLLNAQRWGRSNTHLHLAAFLGEKEIVQTLLDCGASPSKHNALGFLPVDVTDDPDIRDVFRDHAQAPSQSASSATSPRKFQRNDAALARREKSSNSSSTSSLASDDQEDADRQPRSQQSVTSEQTDSGSASSARTGSIQFTGKYVFSDSDDNISTGISRSGSLSSRFKDAPKAARATASSPPPHPSLATASAAASPIANLKKPAKEILPIAALTSPVARASPIKKRIKGVDLSLFSDLDDGHSEAAAPPPSQPATPSSASETVTAAPGTKKVFSNRKARKLASASPSVNTSSTSLTAVAPSNPTPASPAKDVPSAASSVMAKWRQSEREHEAAAKTAAARRPSPAITTAPPAAAATTAKSESTVSFRRSVFEEPRPAAAIVESPSTGQGLGKLRRNPSTSSTHSSSGGGGAVEDNELAAKFARRRSMVDAYEVTQVGEGAALEGKEATPATPAAAKERASGFGSATSPRPVQQQQRQPPPFTQLRKSAPTPASDDVKTATPAASVDQAPTDFRKIRSSFATMTKENPNVPKVPEQQVLNKLTAAHLHYEPKRRTQHEPSIFASSSPPKKTSAAASTTTSGATSPVPSTAATTPRAMSPMRDDEEDSVPAPVPVQEEPPAAVPQDEPIRQPEAPALASPPVEAEVDPQEQEFDSKVQEPDTEPEEQVEQQAEEQAEEKAPPFLAIPKLDLPAFGSDLDSLTQSSLADFADIFDQLGSFGSSPPRPSYIHQAAKAPSPKKQQPAEPTASCGISQESYVLTDTDQSRHTAEPSIQPIHDDDQGDDDYADKPVAVEPTPVVITAAESVQHSRESMLDTGVEERVEVEHGKFSGFPVPKAPRRKTMPPSSAFESEPRPLPVQQTAVLERRSTISVPGTVAPVERPVAAPRPASTMTEATRPHQQQQPPPSSLSAEQLRMSRSMTSVQGRKSPDAEADTRSTHKRSISDARSKKVSFKIAGGKLLIKIETISGFDALRTQKDKCEIAATLRCGEAETTLKRSVIPRDPILIDDETAFRYDVAMKLNIDVCMIVHTLQQTKAGNPLAAAKKFFSINSKKDQAAAQKWDTEQFLLARFSMLNSRDELEQCNLKPVRKTIETTSVDGQAPMKLEYAVMFVPHAESLPVPKLHTAAETLRDLRKTENQLVLEGYLSLYAKHGTSHRYWRNQYYKLIGWQLIAAKESQPGDAIDLSQCIAVKAKESLSPASGGGGSSSSGSNRSSSPGALDLSTVPHSFRLFFKPPPDSPELGNSHMDFYAENDSQRAQWIAALSDLMLKFTGKQEWLSYCV